MTIHNEINLAHLYEETGSCFPSASLGDDSYHAQRRVTKVNVTLNCSKQTPTEHNRCLSESAAISVGCATQYVDYVKLHSSIRFNTDINTAELTIILQGYVIILSVFFLSTYMD